MFRTRATASTTSIVAHRHFQTITWKMAARVALEGYFRFEPAGDDRPVHLGLNSRSPAAGAAHGFPRRGFGRTATSRTSIALRGPSGVLCWKSEYTIQNRSAPVASNEVYPQEIGPAGPRKGRISQASVHISPRPSAQNRSCTPGRPELSTSTPLSSCSKRADARRRDCRGAPRLARSWIARRTSAGPTGRWSLTHTTRSDGWRTRLGKAEPFLAARVGRQIGPIHDAPLDTPRATLVGRAVKKHVALGTDPPVGFEQVARVDAGQQGPIRRDPQVPPPDDGE